MTLSEIRALVEDWGLYRDKIVADHSRQIVPILLDRIDKLEQKVKNFSWDSFTSGGHKINEPGTKFHGYWDTCALSHVMEAGDRLVELGVLKKHPDGFGRRWFYKEVHE